MILYLHLKIKIIWGKTVYILWVHIAFSVPKKVYKSDLILAPPYNHI